MKQSNHDEVSEKPRSGLVHRLFDSIFRYPTNGELGYLASTHGADEPEDTRPEEIEYPAGDRAIELAKIIGQSNKQICETSKNEAFMETKCDLCGKTTKIIP